MGLQIHWGKDGGGITGQEFAIVTQGQISHWSRYWNPNVKRYQHIIHIYRKVASTSPSHLEAHAGFFRLSMKGKFDVYLL